MVSWQAFTAAAPELAELVRARFDAHKHKTMATIRADGSPRICGTEVELSNGQLLLGGMPGNRRFQDLRRDPRVAIHSGSDDPDDGWAGDAKLSGVAVEISYQQAREILGDGLPELPSGPFEMFRIEITEASVVRLGDSAEQMLIIDRWNSKDGARTIRR